MAEQGSDRAWGFVEVVNSDLELRSYCVSDCGEKQGHHKQRWQLTCAHPESPCVGDLSEGDTCGSVCESVCDWLCLVKVA